MKHLYLLIASIKKIYRKPSLNTPGEFETSEIFFTKIAHRFETRGVLSNKQTNLYVMRPVESQDNEPFLSKKIQKF